MESAFCRNVTTLGFQPNIKVVVLRTPSVSREEKYQKLLNELQAYGCGYWKWLRNRRIREVFVVGNITNPDAGKIDKIRIKRKTGDSIELADCGRFDVKTGRSLYGDPKYIVPVEDRRVWKAWELQSLRQRVECALPALRFKDVRAYADMLVPNWHFGLFNRSFNGAADALSEREATSMASCREFAKKAVLGHLPGTVQEFRALVEMMEGDAK